MSDEIELEPCPFCGSDNVSVWDEYVECMNCGANGPSCSNPIALWNERANA